MELSPNESITAALRLGLFKTYLEIFLQISLVVLIIVAIVYGVILLRRYVQAYKKIEDSECREKCTWYELVKNGKNTLNEIEQCFFIAVNSYEEVFLCKYISIRKYNCRNVLIWYHQYY